MQISFIKTTKTYNLSISEPPTSYHIKLKQQMGTISVTEFIHISQFYETIMLIIIVLPLAAYILVFKYQLWSYTNRRSIAEYQEDQGKQNQEGQSEIEKHIHSIEENSRRDTQGEVQDTVETPDPNSSEIEKKEEPTVMVAQKVEENRNSYLTQNYGKGQDDTELSPVQKRVLYFHEQIVEVYERHLPPILILITMGILVQTNEVFTLGMFYFYVISSLMLDYVETFQKLKVQYQYSFVAPFVNLMSGQFAIGIFFSMFVRPEFNLTT